MMNIFKAYPLLILIINRIYFHEIFLVVNSNLIQSVTKHSARAKKKYVYIFEITKMQSKFISKEDYHDIVIL